MNHFQTLLSTVNVAFNCLTLRHGYGEPVLLILHETHPTWSARLALRNDTCALSAVSLNLDKRQGALLHLTLLSPPCSAQLSAG